MKEINKMDNMPISNKGGRKHWIDITKLVAIVAVILDHSYNILYHANNVLLTYFSVSLFIILMGYNLFNSYSSKGISCKFIFIKIIKLLIPYIIATMIYLIFQNNFTFGQYIKCLIYFNAAGPFYYVFLYIQLLIISPLIYRLTIHKKMNIIINFSLLLLFSFFSTNYTNILGIYGGGGLLFGSTYTICLLFGMYISKNEPIIINHINIKTTLISITLLIVLIIYIKLYNYQIDGFLPFGSLNPPGLLQILYSLIIFINTYIICYYIEKKKTPIVYKTYILLSRIGKHTLYIFLYHLLIIQYIKQLDNSSVLVRLVYFLIVLLLPIGIEKLFTMLKQPISRFCSIIK